MMSCSNKNVCAEAEELRKQAIEMKYRGEEILQLRKVLREAQLEIARLKGEKIY